MSALVIHDMPEAEYHAHPALSATGAKILDQDGGPAKFHAWRTTPRVEKKTFDVGHAVHARVLGVGPQAVEIPDDLLSGESRSISSKAAKDWVEAARAAGQVPLKAAELAPIAAMAEAVLAHPVARRVFERPGTPEASVFATDPTTGVDLRCRFDYLANPGEGRTINGDLKTTLDASPAEFERTVRKLGYHIQEAFYGHVLSLARGDVDPAFLFVAVEKTAPYLVSVSELTDDHRRAARLAVRRAIDTYAACSATDTWPGYGADIHHPSPPAWWVTQQEERYL